jgi:chromosome segregation ATPase
MSGNEDVAAKLQKAQKELKEAEKDIQQTMYEKYISDTENALDELLYELETFIEELDFETIFNEAMATVNEHSASIDETIGRIADESGIKLSDAMNSIWGNGFTPQQGFQSVVDAIRRLELMEDKKADDELLSESSKKYVRDMPNENNIKSIDRRIESINSEKESISNSIKADEQALASLIAEQSEIQTKADTANENVSYWRNQMSNADIGSENYQKARYNYQSYSREADALNANLNRINNEVAQMQDRINFKNQDIHGIDLDIQSLNNQKAEIQQEIQRINAENKKVVEEFLKGIVNTDTEKPLDATALDDKIHSITGGYLESYNKGQLASLLGVENNDAKILEKMKSIGFADGGIAKLIKRSGEDGIGFFRNGEGFVSPENVQDIRNLMNVVPDMTKFISVVTPNYNLPTRSLNNGDINITLGDMYLPNVTNSKEFADSMVSAIQNNSRVKKVLAVEMNSSLTGKNSFASRRY